MVEMHLAATIQGSVRIAMIRTAAGRMLTSTTVETVIAQHVMVEMHRPTIIQDSALPVTAQTAGRARYLITMATLIAYLAI